MKVKIYQVNVERDEKRVAFMDTGTLKRLFGEVSPERSAYDLVFDGDISIREDTFKAPAVVSVLEAVFYKLNVWSQKVEGYKGRSLSVSDIIEYNGKLYFCDSVGFKEVSWAEMPEEDGR